MNIVIAATGGVTMALLLTLGVFVPGAIAVGPPTKVDVCHNDDGPDGIRGTLDDGWERISINENALSAHLENHFGTGYEAPYTNDVTSSLHDFQINDTTASDWCNALVSDFPVGTS